MVHGSGATKIVFSTLAVACCIKRRMEISRRWKMPFWIGVCMVFLVFDAGIWQIPGRRGGFCSSRETVSNRP
jgi:hypothetical protein